MLKHFKQFRDNHVYILCKYKDGKILKADVDYASKERAILIII